METTITIDNMTCQSCAAKITHALTQVEGVRQVTTNPLMKSVTVLVVDKTTLSRVYHVLDSIGYQAQPREVLFHVENMRCASCESHVRDILERTPGVKDVRVNVATKSVFVKYDPMIDEHMISDRLAACEYVTTTTESADMSVQDRAVKHQKQKLLWTSVFAIPLIYLAMGHMVSLPLPKLFHHPLAMAVSQAVLSLPIIWLNRSYYRHGFRRLWQKQPNMDSLVAVGTSAAFIQGMVALALLIQGIETPIYFESGAVILTLMCLGNYLEERAKKETMAAIRALVSLMPKTARVVTEGDEAIVPVSLVKVNDVILVKAGEQIALDGYVIEGNGFVDESFLTGESMPVKKSVEDRVYSASVSTDGALFYRVTHVGQDTSFAQLIKLVEEAQQSQLPISKLVDRISRVFVPVVMLLAFVSFLGWLFLGESVWFASNIAIAVLVIACPCALGLATPTAIMVATSLGAKQGILVRNGIILEKAKDITTVVLDKTGTVTQGKPQVTDVRTAYDLSLFWRLVGSVESLSHHPLAQAMQKEAQQYTQEFLKVEQFQAIEGKGVSGVVAEDVVMIGNTVPTGVANHYDQAYALFSKQGKTPLYVIVNDEVVGIVAIADPLKPTSKQAVAALRKKGIRVLMVTGDNAITAKYIADSVGITEVISHSLPKDKLAIIESLQAQGECVMMVGDGINDAPALSRADVGVSVGNGLDIARESADIVLTTNDLSGVSQIIGLSRFAMATIRQNLFWAFAYNIIGIPIAMGFFAYWGIFLNPIFAGFAMSFSSLAVVLNALRLRYKRGKL